MFPNSKFATVKAEAAYHALNFTHKSGVKGIHGVHLALYAILVVVYCTGMSLYLVFSVQGHPYDVAVKTPILLCRIILGVRV